MNETTRAVLGIGMIAAGVLLGLYVGIWVCLVGGIVDVIQQVRAPELSAMAVAWGVAKVFFAGFFGWVSAFALILPGWLMLDW